MSDSTSLTLKPLVSRNKWSSSWPGWYGVQLFLVLMFLVVYNRLVKHWNVDIGALLMGMAPIYGFRLRPSFTVNLIPAIVMLCAAWVAVRTTMKIQRPLWVILIGAVGLNIAVGLSAFAVRGGDWLSRRFEPYGFQYFNDVPRVQSIVHYLGHYIQFLPTLGVHSGTHPPGGVLFLYLVAKLFGGGVIAAALSATVVAALGAIPFYFLAERLAGRAVALKALGLYVVTPGIVSFEASHMDGVFMVPLVVALLLFELAMQKRHWAYAVGLGMTLALSTIMTYATITVIVVMCVRLVIEFRARGEFSRMFRILAIAATIMIALFILLYLTAGFNLLAAALWSVGKDQRQMGAQAGQFCVHAVTSVTNILGFLAGAGVALIPLLLRQIGKPTPNNPAASRMVIAFSIGILILAFSTLFTVETERVWIMLTPLLIITAAIHLDAFAHVVPTSKLYNWVFALLAAQSFVFAWRIEH